MKRLLLLSSLMIATLFLGVAAADEGRIVIDLTGVQNTKICLETGDADAKVATIGAVNNVRGIIAIGDEMKANECAALLSKRFPLIEVIDSTQEVAPAPEVSESAPAATEASETETAMDETNVTDDETEVVVPDTE